MLSFESPSLSHPKASLSIEKVLRRNPSVAWFYKDQFVWRTGELGAFNFLDRQVRRTTIINSPLASISSPEHLAPVFLLWNTTSFDVHLDSPEVPLMDGSALPWFHALRRLGQTPQPLSFYTVNTQDSWDLPNGYVKIEPAETFEVEYSLSRPGYSDSAFISIYSGEDLYPIFSARTFIFEDDFENAKKAGLLSGVNEESGLLLRVNSSNNLEVLSGGALRHPQEPVFHKILDLIGDLTLHCTFLPKLRISIHNGGHLAHHQILERLLAYALT